MGDSDDIENEALRWHRTMAGDGADWDAFTLWLEADPARARAYDAVALSEALLDAHATVLAADPGPADDDAARPVPPSAENNVLPFRRRGGRRWLWIAGLAGAAAASLALVWANADTTVRFDSGAGPRDIALADGTRIALAPHSHLEQRGTAFALTGDAVFDVPHRPDREMRIAAGPLTVADIGTRFDLRVEADVVRLVVAQGRLNVTGPGFSAPVTVVQGEAFRFEQKSSQVTVVPATGSTVGDWQAGHLTYVDAPLGLVIADIARYSADPIQIGPRLTALHFSGTLLIGHGHDPARDLARFMGLALRRTARGAELSAAPGQ